MVESKLSSSSNSYKGRKVMKIHAKWYDVTEFQHPGGPVSIALGYGRDATALFEGHHPFVPRDKLRSMLDKYEVKDPEGMRLLDSREEQMFQAGRYVEPFLWDSDFDKVGSPFWHDVRERVRAYFVGEAARRGVSFRDSYKATPRRYLEMFSLLLLMLVVLPFYATGWWFSIFVLPVVYWVYAVNTLHDAMHFSISSRWLVNAVVAYSSPTSISPLMWYHQHVIGHHSYPNVGHMDPDLAHAPSLLRMHESIRWKSLHRFQVLWALAIWTMGAALYFTVVPVKAVLKGKYNRAVRVQQLGKMRVAAHLFGRLCAVAAIFIWPWFFFPWWKALVWATFPIMFHSFLFMLNTQLNHFTPETTSMRDYDYWRHQVVTAHSFGVGSYFAYIFSGGLNMQAAHHVFPTVNHCHLEAITPMVKECAEKHGVQWVESRSYYEAFEKFVIHLVQMSIKPKDNELRSERVKR